MTNDSYELLNKILVERRSIRKYEDRMPSEEDLQKLVEAARHAPSSTNSQPWMFLVISKRELIDELVQAVSDKIDALQRKRNARAAMDGEEVKVFGRDYFLFFQNAPVVIAALYKPYPSTATLGLDSSEEGEQRRLFLSIESTSAAVQNLLLAAHTLGLGACWLEGPLVARKELETLLSVEDPWRLMCLIPVGYPAGVPTPVRRKKAAFVSRMIS
jgi:nitroreductase